MKERHEAQAFEQITCLMHTLKSAHSCEKWVNIQAAIQVDAEITAMIKEMNESCDRRPAEKGSIKTTG